MILEVGVLLTMVFHKMMSIMKMYWTSLQLKGDNLKMVNATTIFVDSAQFVLIRQGTASFFHVDTMHPVLNVELGMSLLSLKNKNISFMSLYSRGMTKYLQKNMLIFIYAYERNQQAMILRVGVVVLFH